MSKALLKVTAGLIVAVLFIFAMVAFVLPRMVAREGFQETLRETASKALGAPVEWQSLDVGILPPRLLIRSVVMSAGPGMPEDSRLAARSLDLRLAILPIFLSRIEIASLVVRGAEIIVTRTEEGFLLPPVLTSSEQPAGLDGEIDNMDNAANPGDVDRVDEGDGPAAGAFSSAIDRVAVSESRIIVRDRSVSPPVEWGLEDFELAARARVTTASLGIKMSATIQASNEKVGRIDVKGDVDRSGFGDFTIDLDKLLVESLSPFLGDIEASGILSGRISIGGTTSKISKIDLDVRVANASFRGSGVRLAGLLRLKANQIDGEPAVCQVILDLDEGGQIDVDGTSTLDGRLDLRAEIDSFDLALLEPLLPDSGLELGGKATGQARVVGPARALDFVELDVHVESGRLRVPDYDVTGPFDINLRIDAPLSGSPRGRIFADLTASTLNYQQLFKKRAGMPAELTTEFSTNKAGQTEFESRIKLRNIDEILMRGSFGEATSIVIAAPRFDLEGWSEVFPALEPYAPAGFVSFEDVGIESSGDLPGRLRGRIGFEEIGLTLPGIGRSRLRGSMLGSGSNIQMKDLQLIIGGTTLAIAGEFRDPFQSRRFDLTIRSLGESDASDFFASMPSASDTISGDLQVAGKVSGAVGGEVDFYSSLAGAVQLSVGKDGGGRLRGVSILQAVLDQFPILGGAARLTQPFRRGKSIDDYFSEEFELIEGDFEMGDGKVNARTLRLVYEGYEAHLTGPVLLPGLELDMTGEIYLKADLLSVLGGLFGAKIGDRKPVQIPLAHVTNTLSEPKVEMTAKTLVAVPQLLFKATGLDTLTLGVGRTISRSLRSGEK